MSAAVTVLPLNHPLRIAEEISTLDHISEGRLDSGSAAAASWMGGASTMVVVLKQTGNNVTGTLSGAGTLDGTRIGGPLYDGTAVTFAAFRNRRQCTGSRASALEPVPAAQPKAAAPRSR